MPVDGSRRERLNTFRGSIARISVSCDTGTSPVCICVLVKLTRGCLVEEDSCVGAAARSRAERLAEEAATAKLPQCTAWRVWQPCGVMWLRPDTGVPTDAKLLVLRCEGVWMKGGSSLGCSLARSSSTPPLSADERWVWCTGGVSMERRRGVTPGGAPTPCPPSCSP